MKQMELRGTSRQAYRRIKLTTGQYALVSPSDYRWLRRLRWHRVKCKRGYYISKTPYTSTKIGKKIIKSFLMHRIILGLTNPKIQCDHINGNGMDNRRSNLRICTNAQNTHNGKKRKKYADRINSSKYKGVWKVKDWWQAGICLSGKRKHLGVFSREADAARAYNKNAIELFGEFARLNKIPGPKSKIWGST